jgi:hypothetical protein
MNLDDQISELTDEVVRLIGSHMHEDNVEQGRWDDAADLIRQVVEPMVKGHVERIHRLVLSGAMQECETYAAMQVMPAAQLALKQAAIRIAKLAPSVANNPKGGPKKAIR